MFTLVININKKIGHKYPPGKYTADMLKSRINRAGNVEVTLTNIVPAKEDNSGQT